MKREAVSRKLFFTFCLIVVLYVVVVNGCDRPDTSDQIAFDRDVWLQHSDPDENKNPRWRMYLDVKRRLTTEPMSRAEVVALLGPAWRERDGSLSYPIGFWDRMDASSLVVRFSGDGRVARVHIREH